MNNQSLIKIKSVFKFLNDKLAFLQDPQTFKSKKPASQERIQQRIDDFISKEAEFQKQQQAIIKDQDKVNVEVSKKINFLERAIEDLKQNEKSLLSENIIPSLHAEKIENFADDYSNDDLEKAGLRYDTKTKRFHEKNESNKMVSFENAKKRLNDVSEKEKTLFQSILDNFIGINASFNNVIKLMSEQLSVAESQGAAVPVEEPTKKKSSIFRRRAGGGGLASLLGFVGFAFSPALLKLLMNPQDLEEKINDGIKFFRDDLPKIFGGFLQKEILGKITGKDFLIGLGLAKLAPMLLPSLAGFAARILMFFASPAGLLALATYYGVNSTVGKLLNEAVERGHKDIDEQQKQRDMQLRQKQNFFVSEISKLEGAKRTGESIQDFTQRLQNFAKDAPIGAVDEINQRLKKIKDLDEQYGSDTQRSGETVQQLNERMRGKRLARGELEKEIKGIIDTQTGSLAGDPELEGKAKLQDLALKIQTGNIRMEKDLPNESPAFNRRLKDIQKRYDELIKNDPRKAMELRQKAEGQVLSGEVFTGTKRDIQIGDAKSLDKDATPAPSTTETPDAEPAAPPTPATPQTQTEAPKDPGLFAKLSDKASSAIESFGERMISSPTATSGDNISTATTAAKPKPQAPQPIVVQQSSSGSNKDVTVKSGNPLNINEVLDPTPALGNISNQLFAPAM